VDRHRAKRRGGKERPAQDPAERILAKLDGVEPDGRVLAMYGSHADVAYDDGEMRFSLLSPKVHKYFGLCVGDAVYSKAGATPSERIIIARAPRRTELRRKRGEDDRTGHVIAANVDQLLITVALMEPPLRTGAVDRYLLLASAMGLVPIIVLTKIDQAPTEDPGWAVLEPYRALGIPIVPTSATARTGLDEMLTLLRDKVSVFSGHSGVGKSSLCLAMGLVGAPEAGEMSTSGGRVRGRHTTSVARLLELPGGGWVVDTPGVRAIGLVDLRKEDVGVHFPEFLQAAGGCAFVDCLHVSEEDCAVRQAMEAGEISTPRYESYVRLLETLEE
jgi:ribosome biogenesis GTPase